MDGYLTTCLDFNLNLISMMLGWITLIKDVDETTKNVNVTYNVDVNCMDTHIVHYRKVTPECTYLKVAALEARSVQTGSTCNYVVQCDHGNVACNVEFVIFKGNDNFSICEMAL